MTLNAKIGIFTDFSGDFGLRHKIIHKEAPPSPRFYYHVHFATTAIKVFYFIPNPRCTILLCCQRNNLLFSTFLMHSIWWNDLHTLQRNCDILFDVAATPGIGLQCAALTNADWLHWLTCYIFTRESSYCFHRVLAIAILSVCPSVRQTGGSVKSGAG